MKLDRCCLAVPFGEPWMKLNWSSVIATGGSYLRDLGKLGIDWFLRSFYELPALVVNDHVGLGRRGRVIHMPVRVPSKREALGGMHVERHISRLAGKTRKRLEKSKGSLRFKIASFLLSLQKSPVIWIMRHIQLIPSSWVWPNVALCKGQRPMVPISCH